MSERPLGKLQALLFRGDRRLATLALVAVCVGAGLLVGAYVAVLSPLLAVIAAAAVTVGLLMLRSTQWGFFALIAVVCLLPFGALPIQIGFRPTFLDVVLLALLFVWASSLVAGRRNEFSATPVGWPILLFMALACASFVAGLTHSRPTAYVMRHFAEILIAMGLFFVAVNSVRSVKHLREILAVLILAGAAEAAIGIVLYFIPQAWSIRLLSTLGRFNYPVGQGVLRFVDDDASGIMRAIGTSVDPNVLGGLMVLIGGLLGAQLFARRPIFPRWLTAAMLAGVGGCLFLSYSRAAMLGLAAGLALLGALRYRKLLIVMLIAGALLLLLPQTQDYIARFIEGIRGEDRATQMRLGEYKDAFILIGRYPWLGVGFAGTPDIDTYLGVSSAYLLLAEQMGVLGLAAFLLIIATFLSYTLRGWRRLAPDDDLEPLLLGLVAGLSGALVAGVLDHYFFNFDFAHSVTLFWLYIGLGASAATLALRPGDL